MSKLVFGDPPPVGSVIVVRPARPEPCEMPHFDREGHPKRVPGRTYLVGTESAVLCAMHGKARYGL